MASMCEPVPTAGSVTLHIRACGNGEVTVGEAGRALGSVNVSGKIWQTYEVTVNLPAGLQVMTLTCSAKGMGLNWVEFAAKK